MFNKITRILLPWSSRAERKAAIEDAAAEKRHSRARAEHAGAVENQIKGLALANHYSDIIAQGILEGRRGKLTPATRI